jgi:uncharacterized protein GlcG (DUF336 family)
MGRAAFAFKPRTGRAVRVTLLSHGGEVHVIERAEVALLPPGEMAPYHAADGLASKAADKHVKEAVARARRLAEAAVTDARRKCLEAGHELVGCAVLVGTGMPEWTTDDILAVHVRMHKAEGEMFRDVLVEAARACGIEPLMLPDKSALDSAAKKLGVSRAKLDARLAAMGKTAGPPWAQYQKEAAAAALAVLHGQG